MWLSIGVLLSADKIVPRFRINGQVNSFFDKCQVIERINPNRLAQTWFPKPLFSKANQQCLASRSRPLAGHIP